MKRIIFARHGSTDSNARGALCGAADEKLNIIGYNQAQKLREILQKAKLYRAFASPLQRCLKTAEIISEPHNLDICIDDRLKERDFGLWDNLTIEEIKRKYPVEYSKWVNGPYEYKIDGAESVAEFEKRVSDFGQFLYDTAVNECPGEQCILVVSHAGVIRILISLLLGLGVENGWRFAVSNGKASIININDDGYCYLSALNTLHIEN